MKTENIVSCINICKNNPNYKLDGYLAENELLKLIESHNSILQDYIDELELSKCGSDEDDRINDLIEELKEKKIIL